MSTYARKRSRRYKVCFSPIFPVPSIMTMLSRCIKKVLYFTCCLDASRKVQCFTMVTRKFSYPSQPTRFDPNKSPGVLLTIVLPVHLASVHGRCKLADSQHRRAGQWDSWCLEATAGYSAFWMHDHHLPHRCRDAGECIAKFNSGLWALFALPHNNQISRDGGMTGNIDCFSVVITLFLEWPLGMWL